jgi:hypothetical protein
MASTSSPKVKPAHASGSDRLTPSEIEDLRQHARDTGALARKLLEEADRAERRPASREPDPKNPTGSRKS